MELLDWVASHWPEVDWRDARIRTGAFHDVVLATSGQLARTATGRRHAERVAAEATILAAIAQVRLPLPTPTPIGMVHGDSDRTGVLLQAAPGFVHGDLGPHNHDPSSGSRRPHDVDHDPFEG